MTVNHDRLAPSQIAGLVLAGGEGRRMGGNKPFRAFGDTTLIAHVIGVVRGQCGAVMISSNAGADVFGENDAPVVADAPEPGQGPLGGVLAGLTALPDGIDWLVTFPVDCPFVPGDLVARLVDEARISGGRAAFVRHAGRDHYLSSAWHRNMAPVIADLLDQNERRVRAPLHAVTATPVVFQDGGDQPALFANANTVEELASLHAILSAQRATDA